MNQVLAKSDDFNTKYRPRLTADNIAITKPYIKMVISFFVTYIVSFTSIN
jgi:hypothetical protein